MSKRIVAAMRRMQARQRVIANNMARPDDENRAIFQPLESVVLNLYGYRLHIRIRIIHHHAEVSGRVALGTLTVYTQVPLDGAVMKAIEVETLSVEFVDFVVQIVRSVDISRRIHPHWHAAALHIHGVDREPDVPNPVLHDTNPECVAYLNGIAPYRIERIAANLARPVARMLISRMRPHGISKDSLES